MNLCFIFILLFTSIWASQIQAAYFHDEHLIIENEQEALDVFFSPKVHGTFQSRHEDQESYAKVDEAINFIFPRLKNVVGGESLPQPIILIHDDLDDFAQAYYDSETDKSYSSNVIVLNSRTIDDPKNLYGSLAHEMVHYLKNHGKSHVVKDEVLIAYDSSETDCIDCLDHLNSQSEITEQTKELVHNFEAISHYLPLKEHRQLPVDPFFEGGEISNLLFQMMVYLEDLSIVPNDQDCSDAYEAWSQILNLAFQKHNLTQQTLKYSKQDRAKINDWSLVLEKKGAQCFNRHKEAFEVASAEIWGVSPSLAKKIVTIEKTSGSYGLNKSDLKFFEILSSAENPITKVQKMTSLSRKKIDESIKKIGNLENLRFLTEEDEADYLSVKALLGTPYEKGLYEYFLSHGDTFENTEECRQMIEEKDQEPNFGSYLSTHHSNCWRAWRIKKTFFDNH